MFHLNYPRFRGFFAWDELGCLARALGFPVDLFKTNLTNEILAEENGLPFKEVVRMLDYKNLFKALHLTLNLHTADWNTCVIRKCISILQHRALTYEEIYQARVAYHAYEAGDMKGMLLNNHVLLRTLKMCNKTISPMKLKNCIKHRRATYDEPGRIQLYEFLDLILWADGYEQYVQRNAFKELEMEDELEMKDELFKLTDFDKLMSHYDERVASRLDAQYLKDEREFPDVKIKVKDRFKDKTVTCGDSRVDLTAHQKQSYKHLRTEVNRSQKTVHCTKGGFVRERPLTAPDLDMYSQHKAEEFRRKQTMAAQNAINHKLQNLLQHAYNTDKKIIYTPVDLCDKPVLEDYKICNIPKIVSEAEVDETKKYKERLLFEMETEVGRYEIAMDTEMDFYLPGYKEKKKALDIQKKESELENLKWKSQKPLKECNRYSEIVDALAYPVSRIPPSHAKKCDARFRGWYDVRSKKGPHYILMSPYFHDSPKGQLFRRLAQMSDLEIKKLHGNLLYRTTKSTDVDKRPVTAPAIMKMEEHQSMQGHNSNCSSKEHNSKQSEVSSGYFSMELKNETDESVKNMQDTAKDSNAESDKILNNENKHTLAFTRSTNAGADFSASQSSVTSVSNKIKLSAQESIPIRTAKPRAKSAYIHRHEQLHNSGDAMYKDAVEGRQPRSKSAMGNNHEEIPVEEFAPIPHMDHSKPKIVSVGSIGKISLLESITEAKYWEDYASEQNQPKTVAITEDVHGAENLDDAFAEKTNSGQPNLLKHIKSDKSKVESDNNDISFMILFEEIRRRNMKYAKQRKTKLSNSFAKFPCRHGKSTSRKSSYKFSSSSQDHSEISSSNERKIQAEVMKEGEPVHQTGVMKEGELVHQAGVMKEGEPVHQAGVMKEGEPVHQAGIMKEGEPVQHGNTRMDMSIAANYKPTFKCTVNKNNGERHIVILQDGQGNDTTHPKSEKQKSFCKYERLVKRHCDDITPYMKKQLMAL